MAAKASLRCFFGIVFSRLFHVEEPSIVYTLFDLNIGVAEDHFSKLSKRFPSGDDGPSLQAFAGLSRHVVNHGLEAAGLAEDFELAVGSGAALEHGVDVLDLFAAA